MRVHDEVKDGMPESCVWLTRLQSRCSSRPKRKCNKL